MYKREVTDVFMPVVQYVFYAGHYVNCDFFCEHLVFLGNIMRKKDLTKIA